MEVLRLRKCLCGLCSLQTGSLVIGILCLIWNLFMVGGVAGALHSKTNAYDVLWGESDTKSYLNVAFIFSICQAISNILLLFGANEEKPFLLLQWLFVKTLSAIAFIVIVIMFKIKQRGTAVPIIIIIYLLVHAYILLVVYSYYQTLREKSRLPKVRESTEMCEVRQS